MIIVSEIEIAVCYACFIGKHKDHMSLVRNREQRLVKCQCEECQHANSAVQAGS